VKVSRAPGLAGDSAIGGMRQLNIVYCSKSPPSPNGIARYAADFRQVLGSIGSVYQVAPRERRGQSDGLRQVLNLSLRLPWTIARRQPNWLVVEMSGRSLAEFWSTLLVMAIWRFRRTRVWVNVHDAPDLAGGVFWFAFADRRGVRSLAHWLTKRFGRRVERNLLRRAHVVTALSAAGAAALSDRYQLRVDVIRHVLRPRLAARQKSLRLFVPGYVRPVPSLVAGITTFAGHPDWDIVVGAMSETDNEWLKSELANTVDLGKITFAGFQSDSELDENYATASAVLRIVGQPTEAGRWAVSGPALYAMGFGGVLVTDDQRGVRECLDSGINSIVLPHELKRADIDLLNRLASDAVFRQRLSNEAQAHVQRDHDLRPVADSVLRLLLRSSEHTRTAWDKSKLGGS